MRDENILDAKVEESGNFWSKVIVKDNPHAWDIIPIVLYSAITIYITLTIIIQKEIDFFTSTYSMMTFLFLMFYHRSMRKIKIYAICILVSILHLWLYYQGWIHFGKEMTELELGPLKFTLATLLLYQVCRIVNLKVMGFEFELLLRGFEINRKKTILDYAFTGLFFIIIFKVWDILPF